MYRLKSTAYRYCKGHLHKNKRDSNEQISVCEIGILDGKYNDAIALMDEGRYEEAIVAFEAIARPMDDMIRSNYEENCRLQDLRDSLLPRLMSGEVDVSDIEI